MTWLVNSSPPAQSSMQSQISPVFSTNAWRSWSTSRLSGGLIDGCQPIFSACSSRQTLGCDKRRYKDTWLKLESREARHHADRLLGQPMLSLQALSRHSPPALPMLRHQHGAVHPGAQHLFLALPPEAVDVVEGDVP